MQIPRPEGFVVKEIKGDYKSGECLHFTLKKVNWNTLDVLSLLAKKLNVSLNRFGYAGLKDKNAITYQRISAWRIPKDKILKIKLPNVEFFDFEENKERIHLGSHKGNEFEITILCVKDVGMPSKIPNLFGEQRFGGNEILGERLVKGERLNADKRLKRLWVNAYQSKLWNEEVMKLISSNSKKEKLSLKPFHVPGLGDFPGGERDVYMKVYYFKKEILENGVKIKFALPPGSYATTFLKFLHLKK